MKELFSAQAVERAFLVLALAGPVVGLVFGVAIGARERHTWPRILTGMLIGGIGTLVYGLWRLYNVITGALGLDSLVNLGLQLLMFAVMGAAVGWAALRISLCTRRPRSG